MAQCNFGWTVNLVRGMRSGEFNVNVIEALGIDQLLPKRVKKLSGGERQAVSIALCLGREADLYLLDEPSAH